MRTSRVLFCITVLHAPRSVKRCLESAARFSNGNSEIKVLVLDDATSSVGRSDSLAAQAAAFGFLYYRTPRPLGVPRLANIGLLTALKHDYDYVAINDSGLTFPKNMVTEMLKVFQNQRVGSVVPFSSNDSLYSLIEEAPETFLPDQDSVDWLNETLARQNSGAAINIPEASWFSVLLRTDIIRKVGLLDPVFGRGPCEDKDWCLRSIDRGFRVCLAPGVFVHRKADSFYGAQLTASSGTLSDNEAIVELRYPQASEQIRAFQQSKIVPQAKREAVACIIEQACTQFGYAVEIGWLPRTADREQHAVAHVFPRDGNEAEVVLSFKGFRLSITSEQRKIAALLKERFGREPVKVNLLDREESTDQLCAAFNPLIVRELRNYPSRI